MRCPVNIRQLGVPSQAAVWLWFLLGTACDIESDADACNAYIQSANQAYEECDFAPPFDPVQECPSYLQEEYDCPDIYHCLSDTIVCRSGNVVYTNQDCSCRSES